MAKLTSDLRIAIVHYWFVAQRGGERVIEAIAGIYPQADIFTLVLDRAALPASLRSRRITTSFLQRIPGATRYYQKLLPLFPLALEQFRLDNYDLVISSESGPAKGVLTSQHTCHICYCHSPMRYLWDMYHRYRTSDELGRSSRALFSLSAHYLRMWDVAAASRVDYFIANSMNVAARIRKHYRREAEVIHPPVNVSAAYISEKTQDYYLVVSQLVGYKRVDLAIEACNRLGRPLRIIGDGKEYARLKRFAMPHIEFLGFLPDEALGKHYAGCRALLFPGEEDFGIVPVEAQSYGRPVIAYGRGGALETVKELSFEDSCAAEDATGVFFYEQSVEGLMEAILRFESLESRFNPQAIRAHVQRFDTSRFRAEMESFIAAKWAEFNG
ncbi:MAG TPA: glycosyltransferase [Terriglobia bacterium]|nr:glycosyltransferase [Terriglobia bacterium]